MLPLNIEYALKTIHYLPVNYQSAQSITSTTGLLSLGTVLWCGLYHGDFGAEYLQHDRAAHNSKETEGT